MAKDKIIGAIVLILGVLIGVIYTLGSLVDLIMEQFLGNQQWDSIFEIFGIDWLNWRLFVVLPMWLIVLLICIIAIWIGYSMLTPFTFRRWEFHACTRSIRGTGRGISS